MASILGLQNQCGILPKCCNFRIGTELKTVIPEILAMPQSISYNEVPVQSVCLYFCSNINNSLKFRL